MQVKAISMQVHELKESENAISFSFQVVGLSLAVISVCGVGVQTCRRGLAAPNMGIVASAQVGRTRLTATDVPRYSACSTWNVEYSVSWDKTSRHDPTVMLAMIMITWPNVPRPSTNGGESKRNSANRTWKMWGHDKWDSLDGVKSRYQMRLTTQRESDFMRSKWMYMYTTANNAAIVGRTTAGINVSIPTHLPPAPPPPPNQWSSMPSDCIPVVIDSVLPIMGRIKDQNASILKNNSAPSILPLKHF